MLHIYILWCFLSFFRSPFLFQRRKKFMSFGWTVFVSVRMLKSTPDVMNWCEIYSTMIKKKIQVYYSLTHYLEHYSLQYFFQWKVFAASKQKIFCDLYQFALNSFWSTLHSECTAVHYIDWLCSFYHKHVKENPEYLNHQFKRILF